MNSDVNIAAHQSIGPKVSGQLNFTDFVKFFFISIRHLCSHVSYQRCGNMLSTWVKLHYSSEQKLIYINYCTNYLHILFQHLHSEAHSQYIQIKHRDIPLYLLLPKCQIVFKKSS